MSGSDQAASARAWDTRRVEAQRSIATLADDARQGLLAPPRWLPPKYFYDARGSRLFDAICRTPEYYPTRTEQRLLEDHAEALIQAARPADILELGAGTSRKTQAVLAAAERLGVALSYRPFDVDATVLEAAAGELSQRFPDLPIELLVGDYTGGLGRLPRVGSGSELLLFLGGTLGNFYPAEAEAFLRELSEWMAPQDRLLLGLDRVKDRATLEAAYNDAEGVTAEFNRNLLQVLNRELGADFDPGNFAHCALFNREQARIEIYLEVLRAHRARLPALDATLELAEGERILTEISRKFTRDTMAEMVRAGGFTVEQAIHAPNEAFTLLLLAPVAPSASGG